MKYFVFSDAHGDYDALMEAVKCYGYEEDNENHTLISCGDNFGRADSGKGSKGIYDYLTSSAHKNKPICLMGNHELILKEILFRRKLTATDIFNGENKTICSFLGKNAETDEITAYDIDALSRSELMEWILSLPNYFETPSYIFLHGFLPFDYATLKFLTDGLSAVGEEHWSSACWSLTPQMIMKFAEVFPNGLSKTVVFGHWHNSDLHKQFDAERVGTKNDGIWKNEKLRLCGLDCCTFFSHRVEMFMVED